MTDPFDVLRDHLRAAPAGFDLSADELARHIVSAAMPAPEPDRPPPSPGGGTRPSACVFRASYG